jgi:hypothetical protein
VFRMVLSRFDWAGFCARMFMGELRMYIVPVAPTVSNNVPMMHDAI